MAERHRCVSIMQPGYLPWLGYFNLVAMADVFVIYDDVAYDKNGWRNRNRLLAQGQAQWITVPARHSGLGSQRLNKIRVDDNHWQGKHIKTIRQLYCKAPYFDWAFPELESYLNARPYKWLVDLCLEGHHRLCSMMQIDTPVKLSSELGIDFPGKTERLVEVCQLLGANRYISAAASKAYMNDQLWEDAGIELIYQDYPHPTYSQGSAAPFVNHLSVVDALMWVGPDASRFTRLRLYNI